MTTGEYYSFIKQGLSWFFTTGNKKVDTSLCFTGNGIGATVFTNTIDINVDQAGVNECSSISDMTTLPPDFSTLVISIIDFNGDST